MIDHENGNYRCDYCGGENGEFNTVNGNHTQCDEILTLKLDNQDLSYEKSQLSKELTRLTARVAELEAENTTMYGAILEASELGNSAAGRCKVELQRIARNEANSAESD